MRGPNKSNLQKVCREVQPEVWLDSRLALWLAHERILVIADLHWGYAASHRARGNLLPMWGDEQLGERLRALLADYQPAEMLWLGDVVHAAEGSAAAEAFLRTASVPVTVVAGNHDRHWRGKGAATVQRGRFFLHHGDVARTVPPGQVEVIGHHHPAVCWSDGAGGVIKMPALVVNTERLVLPAFSPWAAGADCSPLLTASSTVWAVAPQRIFAVKSRAQNPAPV